MCIFHRVYNILIILAWADKESMIKWLTKCSIDDQIISNVYKGSWIIFQENNYTYFIRILCYKTQIIPWLSGKLWYHQHNCVGDTIFYHLDSELVSYKVILVMMKTYYRWIII